MWPELKVSITLPVPIKIKWRTKRCGNIQFPTGFLYHFQIKMYKWDIIYLSPELERKLWCYYQDKIAPSILQRSHKRSRRSSRVAKHNIWLISIESVKWKFDGLQFRRYKGRYVYLNKAFKLHKHRTRHTILEKSSWSQKSLETKTVVQYSYFSVISRFPSKQCTLFEIFLQFSLPQPYTKLKLGKNSGYTRPTLLGWTYVNWKMPQEHKGVPRLLSMIVALPNA